MQTIVSNILSVFRHQHIVVNKKTKNEIGPELHFHRYLSDSVMENVLYLDTYF